jgi:hypothetical protein
MAMNSLPRSKRRIRALSLLAAAILFGGCSRHPAAPTSASSARAAAVAGCLGTQPVFLRAQLRGALEADLNWSGVALACEGSARPNGEGVRISLAGPLDSSGRTLRMLIGVATLPGQASAATVPANVTLIIEGDKKVYATRGDDKCTLDSLTQQALPGGSEYSHPYLISGRGFCVNPASSLDEHEHVFINRFDFAGRADFSTDELHAEHHRS